MDKILHELLQSGDSAQNYMQGSRRMKIDNRVHLDNKIKDNKKSGIITLTKALQSHSKRSKKHMSMKQHKKYGSLDLPQEQHKLVFVFIFIFFPFFKFMFVRSYIFCFEKYLFLYCLQL